jgi:dTDP-4-dehydrorhamnose reductase
MRLVLFGSIGQVGWELARSLAPLGEVIRLHRGSQDYCGDLTDPSGVARSVEQIAPDVVVNAAAYTGVERAESDEETARVVNAEAPGRLAEAANKVGALLVHYSTDYVFDGRKDGGYAEADQTAPLNAYGRSKLAGETAIANQTEAHLTFRTSWVFARRGQNFVRTVLRLLKQQDTLPLPQDQLGAPTGAELIADVTAHAIRAVAERPALAGLYHLTAAGATSWYAYAKRIAERANEMAPNDGYRAEVLAALTADRPSKVVRPLNSRLDTSHLRTTFDLSLPPWEAGVDRVLSELLSGDPK